MHIAGDQMRQSLNRGIFSYLRLYYWRCRGVSFAGPAFIMAKVLFERFPAKVRVGSDTVFKEGCRLCVCNSDAQIIIGDRVSIGYNTMFFASCSIEVGCDSMIAPNCYVVDANHAISKTSLIRESGLNVEPISIGEDCWVGSGVTIIAGVSIGNGSIIGANSLVINDIPEGVIAAGNPARVIGWR